MRYGHAIAQRLRKLGHEVTLTTREHPDTINVMGILGERFEVVGRYDPTSLATRLKASIERESQFFQMFSERIPDVAISHGSVEMCRVGYGLGVKILSTGDTTYSKVNPLVVPLTDTMIVSKAIPKEFYYGLGARSIVQFDGVDEVAWVKSSGQRKGLRKYEHPLVVVRQSEFRASYMNGNDPTLNIAKKLARLGNVLFLPRYKREAVDGLTVLDEYADSLLIAREADLVVGVGGTIAREAALQGTPSIVVPILGWSSVNDYVHRKGFPLFRAELQGLLGAAKKHLGKHLDVTAKLKRMENPVDVIENLVERNIYKNR